MLKYGFIALFCTVCFSTVYSVEAEGPDAGRFREFSGIFEPSGLVHLGAGEFLLVEDEPKRPFHRLKLDQGGRLLEQGTVVIDGDSIHLNDLEGVAYDGVYLYAITSHSLTKKGKTGKGRRVFIRFKYQNGTLHSAQVVEDLIGTLVDIFSPAFPGMSRAQIEEQINIEALSWSPEDKSVYIGFRNPRLEGKSAVIRVEATAQMFAQQSVGNIKTHIFWLDLQGRGIRSMNWDITLERFIIVAGGKKASENGFELWSWAPNSESTANKITSTKNPLPAGTEGLTTFVTPEQSGMLLVIDDGSEKKSRLAHYQLFPFELP